LAKDAHGEGGLVPSGGGDLHGWLCDGSVERGGFRLRRSR
jgi:hypothetical protein